MCFNFIGRCSYLMRNTLIAAETDPLDTIGIRTWSAGTPLSSTGDIQNVATFTPHGGRGWSGLFCSCASCGSFPCRDRPRCTWSPCTLRRWSTSCDTRIPPRNRVGLRRSLRRARGGRTGLRRSAARRRTRPRRGTLRRARPAPRSERSSVPRRSGRTPQNKPRTRPQGRRSATNDSECSSRCP